MCIEGSVGDDGNNAHADVVIVQLLLNLNRAAPLPPMVVDGSAGPVTVAAVRDYQSKLPMIGKPDGRVDPGGHTLTALAQARPAFTAADVIPDWALRGAMPLASWDKITLYAPHLRAGMEKHGINAPLRRAHFLAQLAQESMSLIYAEEIASGEAYEGRADLGNTEPGDGPRFKGRGLIQLTGRNNYMEYGRAIGRNLTDGDNPQLVASEADLAVDVACWFWSTRDLNKLADADDIEGITRAVNGGLNGLAQRETHLRRAKFFFNI